MNIFQFLTDGCTVLILMLLYLITGIYFAEATIEMRRKFIWKNEIPEIIELQIWWIRKFIPPFWLIIIVFNIFITFISICWLMVFNRSLWIKDKR